MDLSENWVPLKLKAIPPYFRLNGGFNPPKHRLIIKLPIVKSEVGIRRGIQHEQCSKLVLVDSYAGL